MMKLSLYLEPNHCNKVHALLLPTLGKHTKSFIQTIQMIAAIDKELEKPHLHHCLAKLKAMDPNFSLEVDFFDPIHDYDVLLEKEKQKLKDFFVCWALVLLPVRPMTILRVLPPIRKRGHSLVMGYSGPLFLCCLYKRLFKKLAPG